MTGLSVATPPRSEWFPVGSIYINVNTTNPGTIFGGTWEQIKDKFLLCSGNTYSNGSTGGSTSHLHSTNNHTLTVDEIPSHYHLTYVDQNYSAYPAGNNNSWKQALVNASNHATVSGYYDAPAGGGAAHTHGNTGSTSTLPPYLAVTVWKRIA